MDRMCCYYRCVRPALIVEGGNHWCVDHAPSCRHFYNSTTTAPTTPTTVMAGASTTSWTPVNELEECRKKYKRRSRVRA